MKLPTRQPPDLDLTYYRHRHATWAFALLVRVVNDSLTALLLHTQLHPYRNRVTYDARHGSWHALAVSSLRRGSSATEATLQIKEGALSIVLQLRERRQHRLHLHIRWKVLGGRSSKGKARRRQPQSFTCCAAMPAAALCTCCWWAESSAEDSVSRACP